jgi:hypothetical protein
MIVFANSKWLRNYFNIIPHGNFLLLCLYLLPGGWHLFLRNVKIAKKLQLKGYDIVLSDIQAITCFYGVKKNVLCGLPPRDEVILLPLSHLEHKGYMNSEPKNDCLLILKAAKIRELQ